ncbi:hypothetical protein DFQ30_004716 [Apophysomyces sp. BC1015]|nr:hypothetical protein DFQ30_004716 [Apophysomyces sp. BC1015]
MRVLGMPDNVNLNMSYYDPILARTVTCSTNCTLSNDPSIAYQDFKILNPKTYSGLRISIASWYGAGGGLNSVDIFQLEMFVHADNTANFPKCAKQQSKAVAKGTWKSGVQSGSYQRILTNTFPATQLKSSDASVDFIPYLPESGFYDVLLYTPNCVGSSNCNQRTQVDITIYSSPNQTTRRTIDQNITDKDKTDIVYSGYIDATSGTFQPHALLTVAHNATKPSSNTVSIVAQAVQFVKQSSDAELSSILQYDPSKPLNMTNRQSLPWGALTDNVPYRSEVRTMEASDGDIYIGGMFNTSSGTNTGYQNIVRYDKTSKKLVPLSKTGLNGPVSTFLRVGSDLYVGGAFSASVSADKPGLNNVARYDIKSQTWNALNNGVNGPVDALNYISPAVIVSGNYTALLDSSSATANVSAGNSWWNTNSSSWSANTPYVSGSIYGAFNLKTSANKVSDYYIGNIKSAQRFPSSGLSLINSNTTLAPFPIYPNSNNDYTISTGAFWNDANNGNASTIIVGGTFVLDRNIQNVALYQNGSWSGIGANWVGNITSMVVSNNYLYIGGRFATNTRNDSSLAIYDLLNKRFTEVPELQMSDGSPAKVNVIRYNPADGVIVVGGNFSTAGSLSCNSICALDTSASQWNNFGDGVLGENKIIAAGNMQLNGASVPIVQYDYQQNDWSTFAPVLSASGLPGPSSALSYDSATKKTFIAGQTETSAYLRTWDGQQFSVPEHELGPGSLIHQITVLPTTNTSQTSLSADNSSVLLVTGFLNLVEYGNLSAALYDGSRYLPYLVSSLANGSAGSLNSVFFKSYAVEIHRTNYLPTPIVVLVAIASSLAIVFAMVLGALGVVFLKRKRDASTDPAANIASYYGKPPRRPQSLIAMLNTAGANGVLYDTKAEYPIDETINTDRSLGAMKDDKLGYHEMSETAPAVATAVVAAAAIATKAETDTVKQNGLHATPFPTRPELFARPESEIHGRDDSFRPAMRNSNNPFRQSTIGLAVSSDYSTNLAASTGFAPHASEQPIVDYHNVTPPPAVKVNPSTVRWTNAPIGMASAAVVSPISMMSDRSLTPEPRSMIMDNRSVTPESHYTAFDDRSGTPDFHAPVATNAAAGVAAAAAASAPLFAHTINAQNHSHAIETRSITPQMGSIVVNGHSNTQSQAPLFEARSITPTVISSSAATAFTTHNIEPQSQLRMVENHIANPQADSVTLGNHLNSGNQQGLYEARSIAPISSSGSAAATAAAAVFTTHATSPQGHSGIVENHSITPQVGAMAFTDYSNQHHQEASFVTSSLAPAASSAALTTSTGRSQGHHEGFETYVVTPEMGSIAVGGRPLTPEPTQHSFDARSPLAESETVRWTNAGMAGAAVGTAMVAPILIGASLHEEESKASKNSAQRSMEKMEPGSVQWTNTTAEAAIGTFNISPTAYTTDANAPVPDIAAGQNSSNLAQTAPSTVRWTNYTTNSALGVATIGPATNSIYSDISSFDTSSKDALGSVSQSISEGFASDPDFARWTTAPSAEEAKTKASVAVPTTVPYMDKGSIGRMKKRTSGGLRSYQSSLNLSSVVWSEELDDHLNDNYDTASVTTKITDGNHSPSAASIIQTLPAAQMDIPEASRNDFAEPKPDSSAGTRKETFDNVYNIPKDMAATEDVAPIDSHVFDTNSTRTSARWSEAIPLPAIQTDFTRPFGLTPPHEATLSSPESPSVRYKMAQVPSPIETGHVPILLEPSAADTVNLSNTDNEAFGGDDSKSSMRLSAAPSIGLGALEGRASSKRMVEDYFSTRESIVPVREEPQPAEKASKLGSDFQTAMAIAARNNADDLPSTEDHPHLYYAKFDFNAREHGELGFDKGDPIVVVDSSDDIWWMGYKDNGKTAAKPEMSLINVDRR